MCGLALYGFSLTLLLRAELGLDPWDVFHQGLADTVGWSLGTVIVLTSFAVLALWIAGSWVLAKHRGNDPAAELAKRTEALASLFPAPFIVMGHSHVPTRDDVSGRATYFNVGSWTDEQSEGTARTHLVIHPGASPVARFLRWDRVHGPTELAIPARSR